MIGIANAIAFACLHVVHLYRAWNRTFSHWHKSSIWWWNRKSNRLNVSNSVVSPNACACSSSIIYHAYGARGEQGELVFPFDRITFICDLFAILKRIQLNPFIIIGACRKFIDTLFGVATIPLLFISSTKTCYHYLTYWFYTDAIWPHWKQFDNCCWRRSFMQRKSQENPRRKESYQVQCTVVHDSCQAFAGAHHFASEIPNNATVHRYKFASVFMVKNVRWRWIETLFKIVVHILVLLSSRARRAIVVQQEFWQIASAFLNTVWKILIERSFSSRALLFAFLFGWPSVVGNHFNQWDSIKPRVLDRCLKRRSSHKTDCRRYVLSVSAYLMESQFAQLRFV